MSADIRQLESEAEAARMKLAADLAVLRAPSTYSEFKDGLKHEAIKAKDVVVDSALASVKSTAESWIDDIKAKAAANPGAALLIGAGVAWRLLKDPPIATALVGAGLFTLLRTSPAPRDRQLSDDEYLEQAKLRLKEQASDLALVAKDRAADLAGSAKSAVMGVAGTAKEHVAELSDGVKQQASDWRDLAKIKTRELRNAAATATDELQAEATEKVSTAVDYGKSAVSDGYAAVQRAADKVVGEQHRDKLLLGAAGIAVTAALTLALQRRMNGSA